MRCGGDGKVCAGWRERGVRVNGNSARATMRYSLNIRRYDCLDVEFMVLSERFVERGNRCVCEDE